jgi:two-component sensor histidine kinase
MSIRELGDQTRLTGTEVARLSELISEWQMLADLSFADLVLWAQHEISGFIAIAQVRPMTSATVFTQDLVGTCVPIEERPQLQEVLEAGTMIRDQDAMKLGEFNVKEEYVPVNHQGKVIAIITRHRNIETMRTPSKLELNYREIANLLYRMVMTGEFPVHDASYRSESAPRVGDGLVRLDKDSRIIFASPNARSALSRLGWSKDMEGVLLGEILESLSQSQEPREESWLNSMSGRFSRREDFENENGNLDLLVIPLSESGQHNGGVVLMHNVTELRRRDRALLSKDATIREIHHRVKNNLQSVSALLRLQSRRVDDEYSRMALDEAVRRIGSIALVHETLSNSARDSISFDEVVSKIMTNSVELSPRPGEISINYMGEFGSIPAILATPLALIITELIQNSLEHGLANVGSKVDITVTRDAGLVRVLVRDDGAGIPKDFELKVNSNLGLEIVRTLTENELAGELKFNRIEPGTEVLVTFKLSANS